ncbi:RING-H2 finger protein ATL60-like [Impatiens glandulifera]|uniref:RING-H2 finger protein ATL60-like n=1 Tax=Impatiens glandulifera TaxID=253017 RepID=UPI001FB0858E|nr:RING-H2 finger protein ATL60-like [Impatiens glandulifera]
MGNPGAGGNDRNLNDSSQMALLGKIMMFGILGLFFIIIIFLFLHLYNKIFWLRRSDHSSAVTIRRRRRAPTDFNPTQHINANRIGLDQTTLKTIPIIDYNPKDFKEGIECVVCLSDLAAGDKIRLLKTCKHGFHVECIDMWLQSHSTCPVCRNPLSTISKTNNELPVLESDQESPEIQELPTNVLFWGDETEVRNSTTVTIDVASSSGETGETTKPSVIMSRLRSLKRLLSGEKVHCSSSSSNVVGDEHV